MLSRLEQLRPLDEDEIAQLPKLTWLIDQHLPENGLGVIYGQPKSGKTFVAVSMACAVAAGVPWLGERVPRAGTVVYIYAEGWRSTHKRVQVWKAYHNIPRLARFYAIPCPVAIPDEQDLTTMCSAIAGRGIAPDLIVIDTLARCFGGLNESSTQDMSKFVESCDSLRMDAFPGCSVLIVHHSGKNEAAGARGSNALLGAVDVEWEVCKGESYNHLILRNTAQKEREEFEPRSLEKFDVTLPNGEISATIRWSDAPAEGAVTIAELPAYAGMLTRLRDDFGPEGASFGQWRDACDVNENTFKSRVKVLIRKGRVARSEGGKYRLP